MTLPIEMAKGKVATEGTMEGEEREGVVALVALQIKHALAL